MANGSNVIEAQHNRRNLYAVSAKQIAKPAKPRVTSLISQCLLCWLLFWRVDTDIVNIFFNIFWLKIMLHGLQLLIHCPFDTHAHRHTHWRHVMDWQLYCNAAIKRWWMHWKWVGVQYLGQGQLAMDRTTDLTVDDLLSLSWATEVTKTCKSSCSFKFCV